jgi:hypothetical protein
MRRQERLPFDVLRIESGEVLVIGLLTRASEPRWPIIGLLGGDGELCTPAI